MSKKIKVIGVIFGFVAVLAASAFYYIVFAEGNSSVTINVPAGTPPGNYDVSLTVSGQGSDGSNQSKTVNVLVTVPAPTLPNAPTATLTANGSKNITATPGQTINYQWLSTGGTSWESKWSSSGFCGIEGTNQNWNANSASGQVSNVVQTGQVGCTYTIVYKVTNAAGSDFDSVVVKIDSPDLLVTGSISPTTAKVGSPQPFSFTIRNDSGTGTGGSFRNLFQVGNTSPVAGYTSKIMNPLSGYQSVNDNISYTFPSPGNYSVRVCADKSSPTNLGSIPESNEANNCGAWTTVAVTNACQVTGLSPSGTATNDTIDLIWNDAGSTRYSPRLEDKTDTTLRYEDSRYTTCSGSPSPHYYCENSISSASICSGGVCKITNIPVVNGHSYDYWVDASNPSCNTGNTSFTVNKVIADAVVDIRANPSNIPYKSSSNISWTYSGATPGTCNINPALNGVSNPINPTSTSGSDAAVTGILTQDRTYTLICDPGSSKAEVLVDVESLPGFRLDIFKSGQGTVTSTSEPSQTDINCGGGCSKINTSYEQDTEVTLTATKNSGRIFTGWGGNCSGTPKENNCVLIMDSNKTVIVNFVVDPNYEEF